ncbi:hypothetical protein HYS50_00175 [Candidatus Woesearchaeota archaeon]|nr:hypothetical protein [Candidatus Woesearchaeota archaeon]
MQNKQLGILIIAITVVLGSILVTYIQNTKTTSESTGCYQNKECVTLATTLNVSHLGIGLLFALLSLGVYLIFFTRGEQALYTYLEREKKHLQQDQKLKIVHMLLDENERKVFDAILNQEGISQQALRYRTDLSKAAISEIVTSFEKKDLIKRVPQGKTYTIFLKKSI